MNKKRIFVVLVIIIIKSKKLEACIVCLEYMHEFQFGRPSLCLQRNFDVWFLEMKFSRVI